MRDVLKYECTTRARNVILNDTLNIYVYVCEYVFTDRDIGMHDNITWDYFYYTPGVDDSFYFFINGIDDIFYIYRVLFFFFFLSFI